MLSTITTFKSGLVKKPGNIHRIWQNFNGINITERGYRVCKLKISRILFTRGMNENLLLNLRPYRCSFLEFFRKTLGS